MDGGSFDRFSVVVHRLGQAATRRRLVRGLGAGALAAIAARFGGGEVGAACVDRRRRCSRNGECCGSPDHAVVCDRLPRSCDRSGDRCCGKYEARCSGDCDCCSGFSCGGDGRCRYGDGGGGDGELCGNSVCDQGKRCCRLNGVGVCFDPDILKCCNNGLCARGDTCCGAGQCCGQGWRCCGDGVCCPRGWRCGRVACVFDRATRASSSAERTVPFADATTPDQREWIEAGWMTTGS